MGCALPYSRCVWYHRFAASQARERCTSVYHPLRVAVRLGDGQGSMQLCLRSFCVPNALLERGEQISTADDVARMADSFGVLRCLLEPGSALAGTKTKCVNESEHLLA